MSLNLSKTNWFENLQFFVFCNARYEIQSKWKWMPLFQRFITCNVINVFIQSIFTCRDVIITFWMYFSQMFYMRYFCYTGISSLYRNSCQTVCTMSVSMRVIADVILTFKSVRVVLPGRTYTWTFTNPHKKKSHGMRSGDRDGQGNSSLSTADTLPIHRDLCY